MESNELSFLLDACRRGAADDVSKACELLPELINAQDSKGFSPLIIASYNNQPEIVAILLGKGALPDMQDMSGNTALMGAAFKGYPSIVQQLLNAGSDVNLVNFQGAPALTFAATFGQLAIAEMLLDKGARTDVIDNRGKSPLDHAVMQENREMEELIQKYSEQR